MTNQSEFLNTLSADQFEDMFPDGSLVLEFAFRRRIASGTFEIAPEAGRNGRTSINSDEFKSRKPVFGETQHVVAADSKQ